MNRKVGELLKNFAKSMMSCHQTREGHLNNVVILERKITVCSLCENKFSTFSNYY